MPESITGLSGESALHRFLLHRGIPCSLQELKEEFEGLHHLDQLLEALRGRGFGARPVRLRAGTPAHLELPTLVGAGDSTWFVVRPGAGGSLLLEGDTELRQTTWTELCGWQDARILETHRTLTGSTSFWKAAGGLVGAHRRTLLQLGATTLAIQLLALLSPQFTRLAMDAALPEGAHSLLGLVAIGMVLVSVFNAWVGWLRQKTVLYLETRMESDLSQAFFKHILGLPFPFLHTRRLGDLLQANASLEAARSTLTEQLFGSLLDGLMSILYLIVMAISLPGPTVVVGAATVVMFALVVVVGRAQERIQQKEIEAQIRERGFLAELLKGLATVKAAGAEKPALRRWSWLQRDELGLALHRQRTGLWTEIGLDSLRQALSVAILVWGGSLVLEGRTQVGSLMAFVQMSSAFLAATLGLAQAYLNLRVLKPQLAKVNEYLEVPPPPFPAATPPRPDPGPVSLEDVWFRYSPEGPWVVKGYHLRIEPGEKHWIQAPSGFGKSTLLRLIAGLFPPERGTIRIAGQAPAEARRTLVYLPQFVQLYGGSILENLRLLSGGASHDRLMAAAETTGLARFATTLPMGYNTVLPQGGAQFSGGQRQLVALTAVMASDRRILLLDEAMANLDGLNRRWLTRSEWFEGKTVIYASHDAGFA